MFYYMFYIYVSATTCAGINIYIYLPRSEFGSVLVFAKRISYPLLIFPTISPTCQICLEVYTRKLTGCDDAMIYQYSGIPAML